jgi:hypothetical protein
VLSVLLWFCTLWATIRVACGHPGLSLTLGEEGKWAVDNIYRKQQWAPFVPLALGSATRAKKGQKSNFCGVMQGMGLNLKSLLRGKSCRQLPTLCFRSPDGFFPPVWFCGSFFGAKIRTRPGGGVVLGLAPPWKT